MAKVKKIDLNKHKEPSKCYSLSRKQAVAIYGAENVSVDYDAEFPIKRKRKARG